MVLYSALVSYASNKFSSSDSSSLNRKLVVVLLLLQYLALRYLCSLSIENVVVYQNILWKDDPLQTSPRETHTNTSHKKASSINDNIGSPILLLLYIGININTSAYSNNHPARLAAQTQKNIYNKQRCDICVYLTKEIQIYIYQKSWCLNDLDANEQIQVDTSSQFVVDRLLTRTLVYNQRLGWLHIFGFIWLTGP